MLLCLQISHFHPVLPGGWVTKTTHLCSMQNLAPVPKSYPTSTESHQHGACAGSKPINQKPEQILFYFFPTTLFMVITVSGLGAFQEAPAAPKVTWGFHH